MTRKRWPTLSTTYRSPLVFAQDDGRDAAADALEEAGALYRDLGDIGGLGDVEWAWGNVAAYEDQDVPGAIAHMKKSIEYYEQAGNEFGMGWGLFEVGHLSRQTRRL